MAEPALIAVGKQAEEAADGKLNGNVIRLLVAFGVAVGITLGVHRIIDGGSMHYYVMSGYILVILLTLSAPKFIIAFASIFPIVTVMAYAITTHLYSIMKNKSNTKNKVAS